MNSTYSTRSLSLTARISLLFAVGSALVLLLLGWIVVRSVESHFLEMDRHDIDGKRSLVSHLLAQVTRPEQMDALPTQLENALVGHHGLSITLIAMDGARNGKVLFASQGDAYPRMPAGARGALLTWSAQGRIWRGLAAPVTAGYANAPRYTLDIALDITHHRRFMDDFLVALGLATVLAMLVTAGLGWLATRTGLKPLERMTRMATLLTARQMSERIPEAPLPVEIRTLATAFNAMLDRLEDAFRRLSDFSSDIAHELRTPVSNLMIQTQVALGRERTAREYREVLQSGMEEYERLARMVEDMLFLAKADNRLIVPSRENVDLARQVGELMEFHGLVAEERGIGLGLTGAATVQGDRLMLRRAISNLLSNAIRHCPDGETVAISLSQENDACIRVANPGEIPPENLPRLFDRFFTGDPSRRSGAGGTGLGLAIVKSITEAHGGTVTAESGKGCVSFAMHLPGREEHPAAPPGGAYGSGTEFI